jgi:hypothetical protein
LLLLLVPAAAQAADCACGPLYCLGDPAFPAALAKKKADLRKKYPKYLVDLLDREGKCLACVQNGPDGFSLKVVENDGASQTLGWSQDGADLAKRQLAEKKIRAYYEIHAARACACCGEKKAEERPDWDAELGLNRDLAHVHER